MAYLSGVVAHPPFGEGDDPGWLRSQGLAIASVGVLGVPAVEVVSELLVAQERI
jgi:hypothetical protein